MAGANEHPPVVPALDTGLSKLIGLCEGSRALPVAKATGRGSEALAHENAHRLVVTYRSIGSFLVPSVRFAAVCDVAQALV